MRRGDFAVRARARETSCKCHVLVLRRSAIKRRNAGFVLARAAFEKDAKMFLGQRITLGAFVPDDYGAMYCWANDVVAARFDHAFRPINLRDVIASCEIGNDASRIILAMRQRTDTKIIGYVNIHNISAIHRSADLGIRIGDEKHRGQGFGKEALALALDYCWNHLNLERVGLNVFRHNARAIAAYSACGFKKEGILKRFLFIDGAWVDLVLMAAFRPVAKRARGNSLDRLGAIHLQPKQAAAPA
jgi:[ribosomal protein S5]-alanine N-acetyltransferase